MLRVSQFFYVYRLCKKKTTTKELSIFWPTWLVIKWRLANILRLYIYLSDDEKKFQDNPIFNLKKKPLYTFWEREKKRKSLRAVGGVKVSTGKSFVNS